MGVLVALLPNASTVILFLISGLYDRCYLSLNLRWYIRALVRPVCWLSSISANWKEAISAAKKSIEYKEHCTTCGKCVVWRVDTYSGLGGTGGKRDNSQWTYNLNLYVLYTNVTDDQYLQTWGSRQDINIQKHSMKQELTHWYSEGRYLVLESYVIFQSLHMYSETVFVDLDSTSWIYAMYKSTQWHFEPIWLHLNFILSSSEVIRSSERVEWKLSLLYIHWV